MGDLGAKLRQARERRGVSLRQVAAATKISVVVLEALERNDASRLPGGIFSRAFVRSYASEVGLDPDEAWREFATQFPGQQPAPSIAPVAATPVKVAAAPASPQPRLLESVPDESEFESRQRMAVVALRLLIVSVPIIAAILYSTTRGPEPQPADARSDPAPPPPAATPVPSTGEGLPPPPERPQQPAAAAPVRFHTIEMRPSGPCWVSMRLDGAAALTRTMQPGERESRTFREHAVLTVGDGAACEFTLDGQTTRRLSGEGEARTVRITPENLTSYIR
jgi:transcriptional regulator with XRE-family HTH domain